MKLKGKFLVKYFHTAYSIFVNHSLYLLSKLVLSRCFTINSKSISFQLQNRRSTQSTYERSIPTSAVTEYEMPVSICKNTEEGNEEHAVEFRVSAVYHTIPN